MLHGTVASDVCGLIGGAGGRLTWGRRWRAAFPLAAERESQPASEWHMIRPSLHVPGAT